MAAPSSTSGPSVRLPGARTSLALLLLINLFNYIDRYVLAAVAPLIEHDLLPPNDPNAKGKMGLLVPAFMVSYMLAAPVFGWLGDRTRRWWLIGIGVILWTLASGGSGLAPRLATTLQGAGLGFATGFGVLFLTRCFIGVGEGAYGPIAPSLISDMFPVSRRGAVMAWFYAAIPVGSALGYVLGGQIIKVLSWHWAFFVVVPPGLLLGAWCFLRREPERGRADAAPAVPRSEAYRKLWRNPSYVLDVLGMTAMTFAIGGVSYWMPDYISGRLVAEGVVIGATHEEALSTALGQANNLFGMIVVVCGFLATLAGGWLGDKLRPRIPGSYFLVSGIAMLVGFPLFLGVLYAPFPYCWGLIALAVFALFFNTGPTNTIIANVTPAPIRSTAYALCILLIHALGDAVSPPIIGFISDKTHSMNAGFLVVSAMILVAGVLWIWGTRYLARDTARVTGAATQS